MGVFISWSGTGSRSHLVALLLKDWIPKVVQKLPCFVSSHDIEAGARWATELFDQLEKCNVGILCLTREALGKPWILFEAGALAKQVDRARVCPLLIDLTSIDIGFPLGAFQLKTTSKEDMKSLLVMLNQSRGTEALSLIDLNEAFEHRWPQFETEFQKLPLAQEVAIQEKLVSMEQKALGEILGLVRGIAGGRIEVSTRSATKKVAQSVLEHQYIEDGSAESNEEQNGKEMLNYLVRGLRTKRPLITAWVQSCISPVFEDGILTLFYPSDQRMIAESLRKPANASLMLGIVQEIWEVDEVRVIIALRLNNPDPNINS